MGKDFPEHLDRNPMICLGSSQQSRYFCPFYIKCNANLISFPDILWLEKWRLDGLLSSVTEGVHL